ncbi:MAG TPA: serine/threonine-protein kinase, partial [Candidatus Thermoplasmatota archaeon]|nr:serine/threonine-protein kinase [Candidatus Thermoplasmatota archaeon]
LRDPAAALREARALAAVRHPRVVRLREVDRRGDELYLVLEHAPGGSARQLLDRQGPLPPARATRLALDLLEGLDAMHAAGVVHGDVKPENLLLDADGRGVLGDFGSATFHGAAEPADATTAGAGAGSLSTMSPEALRGAPPAPTRDVYAAGALLYRLLTGEHHVALERASAFEARERITLDPPRLPHPRVPARLEPVLRKALAKRPAERYPSAREMAAALADASAGAGA